jgi:hypothetical protein
MYVPILIENNVYMPETVKAWQSIWEAICIAAYGDIYDIQEELIVNPEALIVKDTEIIRDDREFVHTGIYNCRNPYNYYELTLDHTWKKFEGEPKIVKSLRHLHVPRILFEDLGVRQWFAYSFPRCRVTYWDE